MVRGKIDELLRDAFDPLVAAGVHVGFRQRHAEHGSEPVTRVIERSERQQCAEQVEEDGVDRAAGRRHCGAS